MACFPNRAAAECGHYVSILNSSEPTDQSPNPDRPSSPCQGPSCSRHQPIPFVPVPVSVNPAPDVKASIVAADESCEGRSRRMEISPLDLLPADRPDSIFHPPRV
jgi:hypothetical protein